MKVDKFLRVCTMEISFFCKINSPCLNLEVFHCQLGNWVSFALTMLLALLGYSFSQVIEGNCKVFEVDIVIEPMVKKKNDVFIVGVELPGFMFLSHLLQFTQ